MIDAKKPTARQVAEQIGRQRLADELEVGLTAVSAAVVAGQFPARWFRVIERLAGEQGLELPDELFSWRGAA